MSRLDPLATRCQLSFGASSSDSMLRPSPRRLCSVMTLLMGQAEPRASAIRMYEHSDSDQGQGLWVICVRLCVRMPSYHGFQETIWSTPPPSRNTAPLLDLRERNRKLPPLGLHIRLAGFVLHWDWPSHHTLLPWSSEGSCGIHSHLRLRAHARTHFCTVPSTGAPVPRNLAA